MTKSRKNKNRKANRRNASKLSGRFPPSGNIVKRVIRFDGVYALLSSTVSRVVSLNWGTSVSGTTDWARLSVLYQEFRLARVRLRLLALPLVSTTGSYAITGVVAHDPTNDITTSGTTFDYADMKGAKLFATDTNTRWTSSSCVDRSNLRSNVAVINTNSATLGVWNSVDHINVLIGQSIIAFEQPQGLVLAANQTVIRFVAEFDCEFRNSIELSISLMSQKLQKSVSQAHDEKKEDCLGSSSWVSLSSTTPSSTTLSSSSAPPLLGRPPDSSTGPVSRGQLTSLAIPRSIACKQQ